MEISIEAKKESQQIYNKLVEFIPDVELGFHMPLIQK